MQGCLGCRTWFEQGSKLPLEDLLIELKNYSYPIKDQKHKWILLKTIVSFLNSKGGTIYIGVDDSSGQVRGIDITRKQQDEYKLFIQHLAQKIQPNVDLTNRQDMKMYFLPVLKQGTFTGRFVAKIIVHQGELTKLYCITQRIVLQNPNEKKYDDFDVVYSYKRINMGSVKEFSGYEAVSEAAYRAVNPPKLANTFHQGCNPDPKDSSNTGEQSPIQKQLKIGEQNVEQQVQQGLLIHFTKLKGRESRIKLQEILNNIMDKLQIIQYNISFENENNSLIVQFALKSQWGHFIDYLDVNIDQINGEVTQAKFSKKIHEDDYAIYENQTVEQLKREQRAQVNQIGQIGIQKQSKQQIEMHKSESIEQQIKVNNSNSIKQVNNNLLKIEQQQKYTSLPSNIDINTNLTLTITHINTNKISELVQYINNIDNIKKTINQYDKSIQITLDSREDLIKMQNILQESKQILKYGFQGILRFGINTGQITMTNYNKNKYREFKNYITRIVGEDVKRCQFTKNQNKFTLLLTLKSAQKAIVWLDKLVQDKDIKQFRIPKARVDQKMKIDLVCVKPDAQVSQ